MTLIDLLNTLGRRKRLRAYGSISHGAATRLRLSTLIRFAGRRMVTASAGAPAVLLTCGDLGRALKDPDLLYRGMRFCVEEMGFDTFVLIADLSLEAEACGCRLRFSERDLPMVIAHPVDALTQIEDLSVPDPRRDGRMPVFLETMRRVAGDYTVLTAAVVTGPFTLAAHLRGTEIYRETITDPERTKRLVAYCSRVGLTFARALTEAGADYIVLGEPSASLLSPTAYQTFSQAYTEKEMRALGVPCVLHICGNTTHIVDKMWHSGAVAISVDEVDLPAVARSAPEDVVLMGSISPATLLTCSPGAVRERTIGVLDSLSERRAFMVLPGCDLAPETPMENIQAYVTAVRGYA